RPDPADRGRGDRGDARGGRQAVDDGPPMSAEPVGRLRSLLFAPAVRPDFVAKLADRGADAVVIDCEDATPPGAKPEGRANARAAAPGLATRCQVMVRVNAVSTEWFAD